MLIRGMVALTLLLLTFLPLPDPAHAGTAYVQGCGFASGAGSTTIACAPGRHPPAIHRLSKSDY